MKKSDDFCLQGNQRFPGSQKFLKISDDCQNLKQILKPENPKFVRIFLVIKFETNLT